MADFRFFLLTEWPYKSCKNPYHQKALCSFIKIVSCTFEELTLFIYNVYITKSEYSIQLLTTICCQKRSIHLFILTEFFIECSITNKAYQYI